MTNDFTVPKEDYTKFFLKHDALAPLEQELSFTINPRYKCTAGCKICYLKDQWIPYGDFGTIVDDAPLTKEWRDSLFKFADNFKILSTIDDIPFIERWYPDRYRFYGRYAEAFSLSSITDQSLFNHLPFITQELRFKEVDEITFSQSFLSKNTDTIIGALKKISDVNKINRIKIIKDSDDVVEEGFYNLLKNKEIYLCYHNDINRQWVIEEDAAHTFYSESGVPYPILNQTTYLAFDEIYLELKHFVSQGLFKVANLNEVDDFMDLLPKVLQTKLDIYEDNLIQISDKNSNYYKYFEHCTKTFKINQDFNYVPYPLLWDHAKWVKKNTGRLDWCRENEGFIKRNTEDLKTIIRKII